MNIAIMDGKFSKEAYDHILRHYQIGEIATREQIALECASPILLRMKVPVDRLEDSIKEHGILPVGTPATHTYNLTTKAVYEAALSFVSGLYPFIEMIRASADVGERICIAREVPPAVWRALGFSVMTINHERVDFDLTVRLETEFVHTSIADLSAALDRLLQGKLRHLNTYVKDFFGESFGFRFRIASRTESEERLRTIYEYMSAWAEKNLETFSRRNYHVWVWCLKNNQNSIPDMNHRIDNSEMYLLNSDCSNDTLFNLIGEMMAGEPGLYSANDIAA